MIGLPKKPLRIHGRVLEAVRVVPEHPGGSAAETRSGENGEIDSRENGDMENLFIEWRNLFLEWRNFLSKLNMEEILVIMKNIVVRMEKIIAIILGRAAWGYVPICLQSSALLQSQNCIQLYVARIDWKTQRRLNIWFTLMGAKQSFFNQVKGASVFSYACCDSYNFGGTLGAYARYSFVQAADILSFKRQYSHSLWLVLGNIKWRGLYAENILSSRQSARLRNFSIVQVLKSYYRYSLFSANLLCFHLLYLKENTVRINCP